MSMLIVARGFAVYAKDVSNLERKLKGLVYLGCIADYKCYDLDSREARELENYVMSRYGHDHLPIPVDLLRKYDVNDVMDMTSFASLMSQAVDHVLDPDE